MMEKRKKALPFPPKSVVLLLIRLVLQVSPVFFFGCVFVAVCCHTSLPCLAKILLSQLKNFQVSSASSWPFFTTPQAHLANWPTLMLARKTGGKVPGQGGENGNSNCN